MNYEKNFIYRDRQRSGMHFNASSQLLLLCLSVINILYT
jgi:hypothetical protein